MIKQNSSLDEFLNDVERSKLYSSLDEYLIDIERRKQLERQYKTLSLRARIPGPQQAAIIEQKERLRNALRKLPDPKKDTADFMPIRATYYYSNTPGQSSSTWVRRVTFNPVLNNIQINSNYVYPANRTVLRLMMGSKSLGRYFNRHFKLRK